MQGRWLVYVSNDRKYTSGVKYELLAKEPHEASPYSSVYKYSHNVLPARAALGAKGCTDCHARNSAFFEGRNLERPFDENGQSVWLTNSQVIDLPGAQVLLGAVREQYMKPALYLALCLLAIAMGALAVRMLLARLGRVPTGKARQAGGVTAFAGLVGLAAAAWSPNLLAYMTFDRFTLDANHFWIALLVAAVAGVTALLLPGGWMRRLLVGALIAAAVTGGLMMAGLWWLSYTVFDAAILVLAVLLILLVGRTLAGSGEESLASWPTAL
jgi:hypothetical protein